MARPVQTPWNEPLTAHPRPRCSVPGCDRATHARMLCGSHYARWQAHGDPGEGAIGRYVRHDAEEADPGRAPVEEAPTVSPALLDVLLSADLTDEDVAALLGSGADVLAAIAAARQKRGEVPA